MHINVGALRAKLLAERGGADGSWPWTERLLARADRQFGGNWSFVNLPGPALAQVMLPPHAGEPCRGDRRGLVPPGGLTVGAAAAALALARSDYASDNPECWSRIADAAATPFSTIVLSTEPLDADDYRSVDVVPGTFYHLDGFHRLVGWAWAGRLTPGISVSVVVAGSEAAAAGLLRGHTP